MKKLFSIVLSGIVITHFLSYNLTAAPSDWVSKRTIFNGAVLAAGTGLAVKKCGVQPILIGAGTLGAVYGYNYIKHWFQLRDIERSLALSLQPASSHKNNFRFATWRQIDHYGDGFWESPHDIMLNKTAVAGKLVEDIKSGRALVFNAHGESVSSSIVQASHIRQTLEQEKQQLADIMSFTAGFTDVPYYIVQLCIGKAEKANQQILKTNLQSTELSDHEKILQVSNLFSNFTTKDFNDFENELYKQCKPHYGHSLMFFKGFNPLNWSLAPQYSKATKVYWNLFKSYIRLSVIKNIADTIKFDARFLADLRELKRLVEEYRMQLRPMNYPSYTAAHLSDYHNLDNKLHTLMQQYSSDSQLKQALQQIQDNILEITKLYDPSSDDAHRLFDQIKTIFTTFLG